MDIIQLAKNKTTFFIELDLIFFKNTAQNYQFLVNFMTKIIKVNAKLILKKLF